MFIKTYVEKPSDFTPQFHVASIYVRYSEKILLLQLSERKNEAGFWGVPAGKFEVNESPLDCAKRELFEETGILLRDDNPLKSLGQLYIRKPEMDYMYHVFGINLQLVPTIFLSSEHSDYFWASREEAESLPLMNGGMDALNFYYMQISP